MLQENGDELQHSLEHRKLLLLRNLESCAIKSPGRGKRLFTSTIVDDADPPVNFTRSKESSTIRVCLYIKLVCLNLIIQNTCF